MPETNLKLMYLKKKTKKTVPHVNINPFIASQQTSNFLARKCSHTVANRIFSGPITNLLSIPCILLQFLSHANVKKRLTDFKFHVLLVIFKMMTTY